MSQLDPNNQRKVDNEMFPNVDYRPPPALQQPRAYSGDPTIKSLPKYPYMDNQSTTSSSSYSYSSSNQGQMPDPYNMAKNNEWIAPRLPFIVPINICMHLPVVAWFVVNCLCDASDCDNV